MNAAPQALADLKVVEFGGYAAGPHIGKMLGNFGATVVHVESESRPDGFRLEYPPFKDGVAGVNRGGCFAFFNDSKFGVTIDIKKADGLESARRLIDWADLVIENMRPGVMARIGLGYDEVSKTNPDLIMLSTCNMGQTGPRAHTPGFGSQLSSLAGFCGATGEADGPPMLLYGPYIDFIASLMGCSAALAALDQCRRTGKGTWIDISQYECGLHFMAGALLAYHRDGTIAGRDGNRDPEATPHGAYRCRDGRWLALSCWSEKEFAALSQALGCPAMAEDPRFSSADKRRRNTQALDEALADSLRERDATETAKILQRVGVGAYPVNTIADLFTDPQLDARKTWRRREHEEIGEQAYLMPAFDLSSTPGDISHAAPLLGSDNDVVFREILE
jgi:crotonobetainyl-CoA:carnitine CoA-transferase CaiB-like acyl-CoA transferase